MTDDPPRRRLSSDGKGALFEAPIAAPDDQLRPGPAEHKDGKQALFSTGPAEPGTVLVVCSACHGRARLTLLDLGVRLLRLSFWLPGRDFDRWMRCPVCEERTWCSVRFTE